MYKIDLFRIKILQDCPSNLDSFILDIIWISKMNKIESPLSIIDSSKIIMKTRQNFDIKRTNMQFSLLHNCANKENKISFSWKDELILYQNYECL